MFKWTLYRDGKRVEPGESVAPGQRLSWPRTVGMGTQHIVAMAGATFLVPVLVAHELTGFNPSTTLFFSAIGTMIFLLITRNRLPSYLGSSFAFIAPITAVAAVGGSMGDAQGGIIIAGVGLAIVGFIVHKAGTGWLDKAMPPVVTGTIVALIGFNLAPTAWTNMAKPVPTDSGDIANNKLIGLITLVVIIVTAVLFRGFLGKLSILLGVAVGYVFAVLQGDMAKGASEQIAKADWFGLPEFNAPTFDIQLSILFIPVIIVLIAENIGHVKTVAAMTNENLDDVTGRALIADGVATTLAGAGGGSGTTTYAENIGVMAATRIYSTAVYWVAAFAALLLSLSPKIGAVVIGIPAGVLGGAGTVLYGMIGVLGAKIWVENKVNFSNQINLMTAAIALIVGIANYSFTVGDMEFSGIAIGTFAAFAIYHGMGAIGRWRGTVTDETDYDLGSQASDLRQDPLSPGTN